MNLKPLQDRVLIKRLETEQENSRVASSSPTPQKKNL